MNKILKRILIITGCVVGALVVGAGGYVLYVVLSYNRLGNTDLNVDRKSSVEKAEVGQTYKAISYNIGFGAYSQDYTFFMDTGYDEQGKPTCGKYSTARSKEAVLFNTNGAIKTIEDNNPDFVMFQEVDTNSTRSKHINQDTMIQEKFTTFDHVHCVNFHTAFLPYPITDMHGTVNAGLTTISRIQVQKAARKEYTVSTSLSKFFDLDRCFAVQEISVNNGKTLYIINSHMSAYDEGGTIRQKQVEELNAFLKAAHDAGHYVVAGGDWNHDLLTNNPDFPQYTKDNKPFGEKKKTPDWLNQYFNEEHKSPLTEGYSVVASDNTPTCRNNDIEWEPGKTFTCVVDGFIVSDNISVISHANIQTKQGNKGYDGFAFADHDPAMLEFKLN